MSKRLRIPDEDVWLDDEEIAVTQTRTFQRLFNLKQLGLAYLVYPAASHTRGAHSIQCLHEAAKILKALQESGDGEDAKNVRMAALLHDIGHLPFSHTLEDEHAVLDKHDRQNRLEAVLASLKKELSVAQIARVDGATPILLALSGDKNATDWKSDVVGNTFCADLLAYITTDAKWTGIEKRPGHYRIYEYLVKVSNRLCIKLTKGGLRTDIVSAIMDLLDMRYALTERVLFHHGKCVASAMLARAARLCKLQETPPLLEMGDERFLDYLEQRARESNEQGHVALLGGVRSRRLYKRIFKVSRKARDGWDDGRHGGAFCEKWRTGGEVEDLLASVEDKHQLERGALVLWCPEGKAGTKLVRAQVVWDSADQLHGPFDLRSEQVERQFPLVHSRVKTIEDQYLDLWTFWIAIRPCYLEKAAGVVRSLEEELGVECDPVFQLTYLQRLPGYKEGEARGEAVAAAFHELQPQVEQALAGQAARDGKPSNDKSTILAVTGKIAETESHRKRDKEADDQPTLFSQQEAPDKTENSKES